MAGYRGPWSAVLVGVMRLGFLAVVVVAMPFSLAAQVMPIGGEFRVNTFTFADQNWGSNDRIGHGVAVAPNGSFMVTWNGPEHLDSNPYYIDVFAQMYASDGTPVNGEFMVNIYQNLFHPQHT